MQPKEIPLDIALNLKTTALLLIDLQHSTMSPKLAPIGSDQIVANAASLVAVMRARGASIVFSRVLDDEVLSLRADTPFPSSSMPSTGQAYDVVPAIGVRPADLIVTKRQWGAFYGTDLEQELLRRSVRTIVLGGIATNFGVESTARAAHDRGYELIFAKDAMASLSDELHSFCIDRIFPIMGNVRTTAEIIAAVKTAPLQQR